MGQLVLLALTVSKITMSASAPCWLWTVDDDQEAWPSSAKKVAMLFAWATNGEMKSPFDVRTWGSLNSFSSTSRVFRRTQLRLPGPRSARIWGWSPLSSSRTYQMARGRTASSRGGSKGRSFTSSAVSSSPPYW